MLPRTTRDRVADLLGRFPAVFLIGPRQAGKTTLALDLVEEMGEGAVYLDLERPADLARLADPERYLDAHEGRLVVLDEVHRTPGLFQVLRRIIDRRRLAGVRAGQFLLLGSASLDLLRQSSESVAGRMAIVELTPLLAEEVVAPGAEAGRPGGGRPESVPAPWTACGSVAVSGRASWLRMMPRASSGGRRSSGRTWSGMSPRSAPASRRRRCDGSGRCSRTSRGAC